jgi:chemotaxis protein MotB
VTYTSLILLLMTFLIMFNAMGKVQDDKVAAARRSLADSFGTGGQGSARWGGVKAGPLNPLEQDYRQLGELVGQEGLEGDIKLLRSQHQRTLVLSQGLLFEDAGETLTPKSLEFLSKVAQILKDRAYPLSILGYTDSQAPGRQVGPDPLVVSGRRALTVLRYLASQGLDQSRLAAFGLGDTHPLLPPSHPQRERYNNRIDLVLDARDSGAELLPQAPADPKSSFRGFVFDLMPQEGQER